MDWIIFKMKVIEKPVVTSLEFGETFLEIGCQDVPYTETVAAYLVGVGRTYALKGGTDLALAGGSFIGGIQKPVGGKDEVGLLGNDDLPSWFYPHCTDIGTFLLEGHRVKHDSASDYVDGAFTENAGRDAPHDETLAFKMKRVPCIGTALEPGNGRITSCQDIHNLAFTLVSPLEAKDNVKF